MADFNNLIENLNHTDVNVRLESLKDLMKKIEKGEIERPEKGNDVNNHIHTSYSFSPYSPSKAIWMAYKAGLATAGIMDHDSVSGAREFIEAGRITALATTVGIECRADFSGTPLNGRKINNPDQKSIAYVALHGIPHTQIDKVKRFFVPYTLQRNIRNRAMTAKINEIFKSFGLELDYDKDILPLSMAAEGGSVTERHILYGFSLKLISKLGKGKNLLDFIRNSLKLDVSIKVEKQLSDIQNPYYSYDLLNFLKGEMVKLFYIDAKAECPDIKDIISLSDSIGAISAYAYLGDVVDSVTGDKKAQKFEDDYIDELFDTLKDLGFKAVTYMPSRNSAAQFERVRGLCEKYGFFQISGEDINSPRQSFVCEAIRGGGFDNLIDSTWALIGHESEATKNISRGFFSAQTVAKYPSLAQRIQVFKQIGLNTVK
jgi:predicted metal-dependent phosphoesterase TrpH